MILVHYCSNGVWVSFSDDFQIDDYFLFAQLCYIGALKLEASVVKVKVSSCVALLVSIPQEFFLYFICRPVAINTMSTSLAVHTHIHATE